MACSLEPVRAVGRARLLPALLCLNKRVAMSTIISSRSLAPAGRLALRGASTAKIGPARVGCVGPTSAASLRANVTSSLGALLVGWLPNKLACRVLKAGLVTLRSLVAFEPRPSGANHQSTQVVRPPLPAQIITRRLLLPGFTGPGGRLMQWWRSFARSFSRGAASMARAIRSLAGCSVWGHQPLKFLAAGTRR